MVDGDVWMTGDVYIVGVVEGRSACLGRRVREPEGGRRRVDHQGNRFWEKVS